MVRRSCISIPNWMKLSLPSRRNRSENALLSLATLLSTTQLESDLSRHPQSRARFSRCSRIGQPLYRSFGHMSQATTSLTRADKRVRPIGRAWIRTAPIPGRGGQLVVECAQRGRLRCPYRKRSKKGWHPVLHLCQREGGGAMIVDKFGGAFRCM
jgi:hypothetical protein